METRDEFVAPFKDDPEPVLPVPLRLVRALALQEYDAIGYFARAYDKYWRLWDLPPEDQRIDQMLPQVLEALDRVLKIASGAAEGSRPQIAASMAANLIVEFRSL